MKQRDRELQQNEEARKFRGGAVDRSTTYHNRKDIDFFGKKILSLRKVQITIGIF